MLDVYDAELTDGQRRRAEGIERLDEVEEWRIIMKHYCFITARNWGEEQAA